MLLDFRFDNDLENIIYIYYVNVQAPDMEDVKESVRHGVTKVAGRLSGMASGVMSSIQVMIQQYNLPSLQCLRFVSSLESQICQLSLYVCNQY